MKFYKSLNISFSNNKHNVSIIRYPFREINNKEVLIKIKYSCLNYKDALSVTGATRIIRPDNLTPGLDFSGTVIDSNSKKFHKGDKVLATGSGLGESMHGGSSEYIYINEDCLVHIPEKLNLLSAMQIGTAGFTATLAIEKILLNKQKIENGPILVTGATGGVGSLVIDMISNLGFYVIAYTRKKNMNGYLKKIGAKDIINKIPEINKKNLNKKIYAGGIDNVGGDILGWLIKSTKDNGNIVSVGMALSSELNTNVFPLIIRSVNILGISSTNYPNKKRSLIWKKIANMYKPKHLRTINTKCISLNNIVSFSKKMIDGKTTGKTVIKIY